jgi:hypothetical protein
MEMILKSNYKLFSTIIVVLFLASCQKSHTPSFDFNPEIQKAQTPHQSIFISTAITSHATPSYPSMEKTGILRLGDDHCIYIEQPSGEWVLPILVGTYASPLNLSEGYKKFMNKQVELFYPNDIINLKSKLFNENNLNWVTQPPHKQCKKPVKAHIYYYISTITHDETTNTPAHKEIAQLDKPSNILNKPVYIGVYNLPISPTTKIAHEEATLIIEKNCLYIQFPDGSKALPIFTTPRTYWNDQQGALRSKGKDWLVKKPYNFLTMLSNSNKIVSQRYSDGSQIIIPPNPSCNTQVVRYVYDIKNL